LGVFISFLIEFLDRSIKTPEEVQQLLGLPVIGMIPEMQEDN
jgi:capsular polysaccharide biosynthesis protein